MPGVLQPGAPAGPNAGGVGAGSGPMCGASFESFRGPRRFRSASCQIRFAMCCILDYILEYAMYLGVFCAFENLQATFCVRNSRPLPPFKFARSERMRRLVVPRARRRDPAAFLNAPLAAWPASSR